MFTEDDDFHCVKTIKIIKKREESAALLDKINKLINDKISFVRTEIENLLRSEPYTLLDKIEILLDTDLSNQADTLHYTITELEDTPRISLNKVDFKNGAHSFYIT